MNPMCERLGEHQFWFMRHGFKRYTNKCQRPGCDWYRGVDLPRKR